MRIRRLAGAASHARRRPEQWLSVRHGLARERTTTLAENQDARGRPPAVPRCPAVPQFHSAERAAVKARGMPDAARCLLCRCGRPPVMPVAGPAGATSGPER